MTVRAQKRRERSTRRVLGALRDRLMTILDLSERLSMRYPTVARALWELERDGMVVRHRYAVCSRAPGRPKSLYEAGERGTLGRRMACRTSEDPT